MDYHTSISFWNGLRVQPILADEVQTFKALITAHKVLQEGHPVVCCTWKVVNYWLTLDNQTLKESHGQTAWLETCARIVGSDGQKGVCRIVLVWIECSYVQVVTRIRHSLQNFVQFILTKLGFHCLRPEFNGLFKYEEYVTLKGIDDPNEAYVPA